MGLRGQVVKHSDIEGDILTAMITDTGFLHETAQMYRNQYFSDYARLIAGWVMDYYNQYRTAPGNNIQTIYNANKEDIKPALASNVATFLQRLSDQYEQTEGLNTGHMVDQTRAFYRKRGYELLFEQGRGLLMMGRVAEVDDLMEQYRGVAKSTSRWKNPFDKATINTHYAAKEEHSYDILTFRGALGHIMGTMQRGWLAAFLGPMKRGKSFWEQETCFCAATQKRRVAYINLEMNDPTVLDRQYTRLTGLPEEPEVLALPVFDCYLNQIGDCPVPQKRVSRVALYDYTEDEKPVFDPRAPEGHYGGYIPCTECRVDKEFKKYYIPEVWGIPQTYESSPDNRLVARRAGQFVRQYGDRFRQITYPAYSANLQQIGGDIDELIYTQNFVPDIIVIDYADILAPSSPSLRGREALDDIWKGLKRMAGERNALVVTASQTNRKAITKQSVHQTDTAEDIRKVAHVDAMWGLNQTPKEKAANCMRVNEIVHRHKKFTGREVMVLQQFGVGATYLDSAYWYTQEVNR